MGLPIYDSMLENGDSILPNRILPSARWPIYKEALSNLSVYFPSTVDTELESLFMNCEKASSPEEIEKLVKKAYSTMEMMLSES